MATFVEPAAGVRAAMRMSERLHVFDRTSSSDLTLKMGLHRGHAIAVTSNDTVDYFGQTANIAALIQALADAGDICISDGVFAAEGVADVIADASVRRDSARLKGVGEAVTIQRLT